MIKMNAGKKTKNKDNKGNFKNFMRRARADCKSAVTDFGGPNPPLPTTKSTFFYLKERAFCMFYGKKCIICAYSMLATHCVNATNKAKWGKSGEKYYSKS